MRCMTSPDLSLSLPDRARGALLGLACGDAVGTTVEFSPRGSFAPVTDMVGGGPFSLRPGQWTDDTSMALCLADSLIACQGFGARDQMNRYLNWWRWGYLSSTGDCFDIGITVRAALARFEANGEPFAGSIDPQTAGNGSLMRLAPVVLAFANEAQAVAMAADSSRTTHGAPEAVDCCRLLAHLLHRALASQSLAQALVDAPQLVSEPAVRAIAQGEFMGKPESQIKGSGYSVASLEAALWCVAQSNSFEAAVLRATNLGDDADTTAAIAGQLAGALWGETGIPAHWLARLHLVGDMRGMADALLTLSGR